jgi:hypothetical protein
LRTRGNHQFVTVFTLRPPIGVGVHGVGRTHDRNSDSFG